MTAMNGHSELLSVAALLERAYGLALVLLDEAPAEGDTGSPVAHELVDVLDELRVTVLRLVV